MILSATAAIALIVAAGPPALAQGLTGEAKFELPFPVLLLGAITGMTYGILAVGLVLIYRSSRIVNFAHGEIGTLAAAVMATMVLRWHVPYWLAFAGSLALAAAIGSASEAVVVRRLREAPLAMSIVATLGLAQFFFLFSLVINSQISAGQLYPQPAGLPEFDVAALRVTKAYSAMLLVTPVLVAGLTWFLRRTRVGLQIRAAAANRDAARAAGVFAGRMSTITWGIAGAVAAFTAILILPTRGFSSAELLGPALLLRALTAAVIARMENLPVALGAGLAVGVLEQALLWNSPQSGAVEALLFAAVVVTLLAQRRKATGRGEERGSWVSIRPWASVPEGLRQNRWGRDLGKAVGATGLAVAVAVGALATNAASVTLVTIVAFVLVGLSVGIVTGLSGQLSLGQFAIAGVGATASVVVMRGTHNTLLAFLAATTAGGVASLLIGLPALRIRGLMLAVVTLGFGLAAQNWLFPQSWMMGEGMEPGLPHVGPIRVDTGRRYYYFSLVVLAVGLWVARNIWTTGLGRRLRAVRENEDGARAFTVSATAAKLQGFVLAGVLAGLGGAVYGHVLSRMSATAFPIRASIDVAALTVLGGLGILAGPLLGALYIIGIPAFVPLDNAGLAATQLGWLLLVLYLPGGLAQALAPLRERLLAWLVRHDQRHPGSAEAEYPDDSVRPVPTLSRFARSAPLSICETVLSVEGVSRTFGGIRAVDDVTFRVTGGETVGLIGPNGAGKTTLFDLISGFGRIDSGAVHFWGSDVTRLSPEQRAGRGLIRSFQDAALFATLTVEETVMLALERVDPTRLVPSLLGLRLGERRKIDRARELIDLMGLTNWRTTPTADLSTGTRRITELACLVALEPALLLLDEPTAGIAQRETEALGGVLMDIRKALGITILIIEHDIPLVMGISDRIIAMESGRIIASGTPEAIRNDPRVVASYLGTDQRSIERSGVRQ